jgi:PEGA domain
MIAAKPPELDPEWVAEKAAKIAAGAEAERKKPSRTVAVVILSLVMAAIFAVIVVMVMQRQPIAKGESIGGVEITITAPKPGTPITVDGVKAGNTPQSLKIKGRTRPIEIKGNGVTKIVTPDHDQIVNLVP